MVAPAIMPGSAVEAPERHAARMRHAERQGDQHEETDQAFHHATPPKEKESAPAKAEGRGVAAPAGHRNVERTHPHDALSDGAGASSSSCSARAGRVKAFLIQEKLWDSGGTRGVCPSVSRGYRRRHGYKGVQSFREAIHLALGQDGKIPAQQEGREARQ